MSGHLLPDRSIFGFTGTQQGMSEAQLEMVGLLARGCRVAHHGDCIGADAEFHALCLANNVAIVIHPPAQKAKRAFCTGAVAVEPQMPYLTRNAAIVKASALMIATPKEDAEPDHQRAGGTWWTIRHARGLDKPMIIIWPDGSADTNLKWPQ